MGLLEQPLWTLESSTSQKAFFMEDFQGFYFSFPESLILLLLGSPELDSQEEGDFLEDHLVLPSVMAVGTLHLPV